MNSEEYEQYMQEQEREICSRHTDEMNSDARYAGLMMLIALIVLMLVCGAFIMAGY